MRYRLGEEIANSITHGLGALLSAAGVAILIVAAVANGNSWHIVSFSIFGTTLVLLYLASTLYHSFSHLAVKKIFKVIDHSAIYLLIAGSYTPFLLVNLRGWWGWSLLAIIWACAIAGIVLKGVCIGRFHKTSVAIYVAMGWICIVAFKQFLIHVPYLSMLLLILGGLSYTVGIIFYAWQKMPYNHAVWHLFVLSGSVLHYLSVLATLRPTAC